MYGKKYIKNYFDFYEILLNHNIQCVYNVLYANK